jgi:hypothetical protein
MYRDTNNEVAFRHLPKHVKTYVSESPLGPADGKNLFCLAAMSASHYNLVKKATSLRASTLLTEYPCFDQDTGDMILDTREETIPRAFTSYPISTLDDYFYPNFMKAYNFEWNRQSDVLVGFDYDQLKHWWFEILPGDEESEFPDKRTMYADGYKRLRATRGIKGKKTNSKPKLNLDDDDRYYYGDEDCHADILPHCDCGCEEEQPTLAEIEASYDCTCCYIGHAGPLTEADLDDQDLAAARESTAHWDLTEEELASRSINLLQNTLSTDMFSTANEDTTAEDWWECEIEPVLLPIKTRRAIVKTPNSDRGAIPGTYVPKRSSPLKICLNPGDFDFVDESDASEEQVVNYWF